MASPSQPLTTQRPDLAGSLEEFDLAADRRGFIGQRVFPVMEVASQAGVFGRIPVAQLLSNRDTRRSSGSGYSRQKFTFVPDFYATAEYGAEEPVDDRESTIYREYFDAEMISTQRAQDVVLRDGEQRVADKVFDPTFWTGAPFTTAIGTPWDVPATADPVADVEAAVIHVYDNSGMWPNALIISRKTFRLLRNVQSIIDRSKSQDAMDVRAGAINESQLEVIFDIDNVIVAGSSKNTANQGQAAAFDQIWNNDMAMIAKINVTNDIREPGLGRTFHWAADGSQIGATVETYREETNRGNVVRARNETDEKRLYKEAGHLLTGITT